MMKPVKGRQLKADQEVFVYFNLHKKCFSVKDVKSGLVVAHTDNIVLYDVTFKVSESGRQRVLREQKKNVHAGVRGKVWSNVRGSVLTDLMTEATYNPYKYKTFVTKETETPVEEASMVILDNKRIFFT